MNIIYIAILILAAFIAIWIFIVVPAEKRHHERKLEMIKKKIADREIVRQEDSFAVRDHGTDKSDTDREQNQ